MVSDLLSADHWCEVASLRDDVQLLVEVEELVAESGEHVDAPDEGARHRRIEDVRVFGEIDAQRLRTSRRCQGDGNCHEPLMSHLPIEKRPAAAQVSPTSADGEALA